MNLIIYSTRGQRGSIKILKIGTEMEKRLKIKMKMRVNSWLWILQSI